MSTSYKILAQQQWEEGQYIITPIRHQDMPKIKEWRNAQLSILRQKKTLTDQEQKRYWQEEILPSFQETEPKQILFSYLKDGVCIGYGGITHIDWEVKRGEVSFLLDTRRDQTFNEEFFIFLQLLIQVAFKHLNFHRLCTETYAVRPYVIEVLERCGFQKEGVLRKHVLVEGRYTDAILHGLLR